MRLLDSDIVSASMRLRSEPAVRAWLDRLPDDDLCTSAITIYEIRRGIGNLAAGRRRTELSRQFEHVVRTMLAGRVLAFDAASAEAAAKIEIARRRSGTPMDMADTLIAGIAVANGVSIVTRNVRHFAGLPVPVIDPWAAG